MTHASKDVRDAFEEFVETGVERRYTEWDMARELKGCTDVMPDSLCAKVGLPSGATYAAGVTEFWGLS